MSRLSWILLLSLGIASPGSAVPIEWVMVGKPGNAGDPEVSTCCGSHMTGASGFGAVPYAFAMSKFEVTNAQYAEFLNAIAATDDLHQLYEPEMEGQFFSRGGIHREGTAGSYSYSPLAGRESWPVNWVDYADVKRFANWLHNGRPVGLQDASTTEDGAYTFYDHQQTLPRNDGARFFLPNEDEWYKAAYYDPSTTSFLDYPMGWNAPPLCRAPNAGLHLANCDAPGVDSFDADVDGLTPVGSFPSSASPNGTYDQGGNIMEWAKAWSSRISGCSAAAASIWASRTWPRGPATTGS